MRILIVGGGIAGLAIANLYKNKPNVAVHLIEKSDGWKTSSTSLYVTSNGMKVLEHMGLGDQVRSAGYIVNERVVYNTKGKTILKINLEDLWHRSNPCVCIKRASKSRVTRKNIALLAREEKRLC